MQQKDPEQCDAQMHPIEMAVPDQNQSLPSLQSPIIIIIKSTEIKSCVAATAEGQESLYFVHLRSGQRHLLEHFGVY